MNRLNLILATCVVSGVLSTALPVTAAIVEISGGQTSVLLNTAALSAAANLNLSGVGGATIVPGNLGAGSVAFPINPRDAVLPSLATTFAYDSNDFLGTFSGTIEHSGTVLFNANAVEVGNFRIGFEAGRIGGSASGFYVESTTGIAAILFDVGNPAPVVTPNGLTIPADLLVSPEFAQFLLGQGLASTNLTGVDVGDALVQAVPEPSTLVLLVAALPLAFAAWRRRR